MDNGNVYNETTEPQAKPSRCFGCTLRHLWGWRLPAKALQVVSRPAPRRCPALLSPERSEASVAVADGLPARFHRRWPGRAGPCAQRAPTVRMAAGKGGERPRASPGCAGPGGGGVQVRRTAGGAPLRRLGAVPPCHCSTHLLCRCPCLATGQRWDRNECVMETSSFSAVSHRLPMKLPW